MTRLPDLGPRGEGWVIVQGVLLVGVGVAGALAPRYAGPLWQVDVALGCGLVVAGLALALRGITDLGRGLTPFPHPRPDAALVETGSYRLVRHPIYGGIVIAAAGYGLVVSSPLVAIGGAAILLVFFRLKSTREEAWLADRYPGYAAYRARTRRLIPFVY